MHIPAYHNLRYHAVRLLFTLDFNFCHAILFRLAYAILRLQDLHRLVLLPCFVEDSSFFLMKSKSINIIYVLYIHI